MMSAHAGRGMVEMRKTPVDNFRTHSLARQIADGLLAGEWGLDDVDAATLSQAYIRLVVSMCELKCECNWPDDECANCRIKRKVREDAW